MSDAIGNLLLSLGRSIRSAIVRGRLPSGLAAMPVARQAGDTIYEIDRRVEHLILEQITAWPIELKPLVLVVEGLGESGRTILGPPGRAPKYRLLIDPIDGTRSLMYDKRSAWFLAALAPERGDDTRLSQAIATAMVELPTSKQSLCDEFLAVAGAPLIAQRVETVAAKTSPLRVSPSTEVDLRHGFGHVVSFFPGTKKLAAELLELIAAETIGQTEHNEALLFDDQYISTGGQFVELMMGRDRFCCDLRPLFYDIAAGRSGAHRTMGLNCHPYDIAGLKAAESAGVVLTDGFGNPLDAPFTTSDAVHWCGYANNELRAKVAPVIHRWLESRL